MYGGVSGQFFAVSGLGIFGGPLGRKLGVKR